MHVLRMPSERRCLSCEYTPSYRVLSSKINCISTYELAVRYGPIIKHKATVRLNVKLLILWPRIYVHPLIMPSDRHVFVVGEKISIDESYPWTNKKIIYALNLCCTAVYGILQCQFCYTSFQCSNKLHDMIWTNKYMLYSLSLYTSSLVTFELAAL